MNRTVTALILATGITTAVAFGLLVLAVLIPAVSASPLFAAFVVILAVGCGNAVGAA